MTMQTNLSVYHDSFSVRTRGKGTTEITSQVEDVLRASGLSVGQISVFCKHTSASLVIMENADPTARRDLEQFMERLVPEDEPYFVHTMEGPDDMPSHIKMALTRTTEVIPFTGGYMSLGTWQGIFLWEHRAMPHNRHIVVSVLGG